GGHSNVPVIEVLVKAGDAVKKDQGLVTLESDKATMEVPAPFAGIVREVKLKVGDEVSEGAVVALVEATDAAPAPQAKVAEPKAAAVVETAKAAPPSPVATEKANVAAPVAVPTPAIVAPSSPSSPPVAFD